MRAGLQNFKSGAPIRDLILTIYIFYVETPVDKNH